MNTGYGGLIKRVLTTIGESDPTKQTYLSRLFHRRRYRALVAIIRNLSNGRVRSLLDVGCGKGFLYQALVDSHVNVELYIGLDIDCTKLLEAKKLSICADALTMPIVPCAVDYTVASEVLEHLDKPFIALKNMIEVTKEYLIVTFPDETIKNALGFRYPEHVSKLDANEITILAQKHGFKKILHYRLNYLVPPSIFDKFLPYNEGILRVLEAFQRISDIFGYLSMIKSEIMVFKRIKTCQSQ